MNGAEKGLLLLPVVGGDSVHVYYNCAEKEMIYFNIYITNQYYHRRMVQIQKQDRKRVYTYLLKEGVIVIHKDFSLDAHKATGVPNLQVWMLLRSLKDRGFVELVFNWQYYYYFLNDNGKKYLADFLGLTEEVVPLTWKKDEKRQYQFYDDKGKVRKVRRDRDNAPNADRPAGGRGGRGGRRPPRAEGEVKKEQTPAETPVQAQ